MKGKTDWSIFNNCERNKLNSFLMTFPLSHTKNTRVLRLGEKGVFVFFSKFLSPNPNPNPNRKIVQKSRFELKSKKFIKSKPKIDVSLSNNNIFKSFFVNRLPILCYMFNSPLVVLLYLVIELLTRSILEQLNRTVTLSKLNIVTSFVIGVYKTMYRNVSIISD